MEHILTTLFGNFINIEQMLLPSKLTNLFIKKKKKMETGAQKPNNEVNNHDISCVSDLCCTTAM